MKINLSLFLSHLTYGITCWGGTYKSAIQIELKVLNLTKKILSSLLKEYIFGMGAKNRAKFHQNSDEFEKKKVTNYTIVHHRFYRVLKKLQCFQKVGPHVF